MSSENCSLTHWHGLFTCGKYFKAIAACFNIFSRVNLWFTPEKLFRSYHGCSHQRPAGGHYPHEKTVPMTAAAQYSVSRFARKYWRAILRRRRLIPNYSTESWRTVKTLVLVMARWSWPASYRTGDSSSAWISSPNSPVNVWWSVSNNSSPYFAR